MTLVGLFIEGLLSFLSPCVLPMIPLYMSYLATDKKDNKLEVFLNSLCFVLGLSLIFLILALAVDTIKPFLDKYSDMVSLISGILIILFGLKEVGILKIQLPGFNKVLDFDTSNMNYFKAFLLGFVFSLVMSPCIGPMLSSAILIGANSASGFLYVMVYALGLLIPFFITGLFTSKVVTYLKSKKHVLKYVSIVAGVILIIYGSYSFMNGYKNLNKISNNNTTTVEDKNVLPSGDFFDQDGNVINFSDYKDKYVTLNFIATWCHYCIKEIPDYQAFAKENDDVKSFYVMSSNTSGASEDQIKEFIKEQGIELQVIIDNDDTLYSLFRPSGYPTMFVAGKDNKILGYVSGAYEKDGLNSLLNKVKEQEN